MPTGLFTVGEGYCLQPKREGCSPSLVFTHEPDRQIKLDKYRVISRQILHILILKSEPKFDLIR